MSAAVQIYQHFKTPKEPGLYYRLVCLTGDSKGKAFFLMGKRAVMGRSEKCDITLLDLRASREHAEIAKVGAVYILTDLNSKTGVIVNDLKVKQHTLTEGDKIIIGKTVLKFSSIQVNEDASSKAKRTSRSRSYDSYEPEEEEEPKNKKLTYMLGALILFAVLLIGVEEKETSDLNANKKNKNQVEVNVKEISSVFNTEIKKRTLENKQNKEKLQVYFSRGLREYREGNYFRAISEFESAKQWVPNDPLANFYLRKTREALDEKIESYFSKAIRDSDALNYRKSSVSYCAIIRLLNSYKSDPRYVSANEAIRSLEDKMGLDEGEIECVKKDDGES